MFFRGLRLTMSQSKSVQFGAGSSSSSVSERARDRINGPLVEIFARLGRGVIVKIVEDVLG